jgi:hypothetical protein
MIMQSRLHQSVTKLNATTTFENVLQLLAWVNTCSDNLEASIILGWAM